MIIYPNYVKQNIFILFINLYTILELMHAMDDLKAKNKEIKFNYLKDINKKLYEARCENNGRIPHQMIQKIIESSKVTFPWLTRNVINRSFREFLRDNTIALNTTVEANAITIDASSNEVANILLQMQESDCQNASNQAKGGRPKNSTNDKKKFNTLAITAFYNEIAVKYSQEKQSCDGRMQKGRFDQIVMEIRAARDVDEKVKVSKAMIQRRCQRNSFILPSINGGKKSPLADYEDHFVSMIIQLSRCRHSITAGEGLQLINSMMKGTVMETRMKQWKISNTYVADVSKVDGSVGHGYWRGFCNRQSHRIVTKRGQKFELDRQNWCTYSNFKMMYDNVGDYLIEAGVAELVDDPSYQDRDGNDCDFTKSFGFPVTHRIKHPDYCLVADEVGGNVSQKGDGNVGGTRFLCEKGSVPKQVTSNKDKHFTLLGFTALSGEPAMCCVVFSGKNQNPYVEAGCDFTKEFIGDFSDPSFFENNFGEGRAFPGGPSCMFKGKKVPCFVRWSDKGGVTSTMLTDVLREFDARGMFPRTEGRLPFVLLDGHGSRTELEFLTCINDPLHKWVVCLGVPHGTSLWQVGDSSQQNGHFNVILTKSKAELVQLKSSLSMNLQLQPSDAMLLTQKAWDSSFANVATNKQAISERGWLPHNRVLLNHPEMRPTMTTAEIGHENNNALCSKGCNEGIKSLDSSLPKMSTSCLPASNAHSVTMNFSDGFAATCLERIVQHKDMHQARENITKRKHDGNSIKERLSKFSKLSAGNLVKAGANRLGKDTIDLMIERRMEKERAEKDKLDAIRSEWKKVLLAYSEFHEKNKPQHLWNVKDHEVVLKALKQNRSEKTPKRKQDLVDLHEKWKTRTPLNVEDIGLDFNIRISTCNEDDVNGVNVEGDDMDLDFDIQEEEGVNSSVMV